MATKRQNKELDLLRKTLKKEGVPDEDIRDDVRSYSGGSFDDAFDLGVEYGRSELAQEILRLFARTDEYSEEDEKLDEEIQRAISGISRRPSEAPTKPVRETSKESAEEFVSSSGVVLRTRPRQTQPKEFYDDQDDD